MSNRRKIETVKEIFLLSIQLPIVALFCLMGLFTVLFTYISIIIIVNLPIILLVTILCLIIRLILLG